MISIKKNITYWLISFLVNSIFLYQSIFLKINCRIAPILLCPIKLHFSPMETSCANMISTFSPTQRRLHMTSPLPPKKNDLCTNKDFQACYLLLQLTELKIRPFNFSKKKVVNNWLRCIRRATRPYCQEKTTNKESKKCWDLKSFFQKMLLSSLKMAWT